MIDPLLILLDQSCAPGQQRTVNHHSPPETTSGSRKTCHAGHNAEDLALPPSYDYHKNQNEFNETVSKIKIFQGNTDFPNLKDK